VLHQPFMAIGPYYLQITIIKKYRPNLGNRYDMIAMENKWNVSGKRSGAGRKLGERERSGGHRTRWSTSGSGDCGAGTERRAGILEMHWALRVQSWAPFLAAHAPLRCSARETSQPIYFFIKTFNWIKLMDDAQVQHYKITFVSWIFVTI